MLVRSAALFAAAFVVAGCSSPPDSTPQSGEPVGTSAAAITTTDVLSRAEQWVTAKLLYCQSANHQPDYDTACSSTCNRQDNPSWDPYRSDCSGFVSWAWGLPAPGRVTSTFAPFDTAVSHTIQATDLQPGDAVNETSGGHIMLFVKWVTKDTEAEFYEEPGCSASTPYAHSFTSSVSINGSSVYVSWNGMTFTSIRYDNISPPDAPPTGNLDTATCDTITGWAQDPDSKTTALEVELTFDAPDGQAGAADTVTQKANISRPDLCTAIGSCTQAFSVVTPAGLKDGAKHTVYAYAKDAQTGILTLLPSAPKTLTCAPPSTNPPPNPDGGESNADAGQGGFGGHGGGCSSSPARANGDLWMIVLGLLGFMRVGTRRNSPCQPRGE